MWSELVRTWLLRWRSMAAIVLFPALCMLVLLWGVSTRDLGTAREEPAEGVYWSASQYQIQFGKLREELLAIASTPGDPERALPATVTQSLQLRVDILNSRTLLLTEPSAVRDRLLAVPGFEQHATSIAVFNQQLQNAVGATAVTPAQARALLTAFDAIDPTVESLANTARQREMDERTRFYEGLQQRTSFAWLAVALLVGWMVSMLVARRRDRRLAHERLLALEAAQDAKAALQRSINAKAQFLSMVSHELRSPLQVIVSSVDLVGPDTPADERRAAIGRVRRAATSMGVQLRDLLMIARGEAGRFEMNPEPFEATALVEEVAEVASHLAQEKGLRFVTASPSEPVFARADVQRIGQVLANLLSNAVKYTRSGSVSLTLLPPDAVAGTLVWIVADTGPGLPEAASRRLQVPVSRDEDLRPRSDGSGVGLMVVRTAIDHLGGTLAIDARSGTGTRVTVTVPVLFEQPDLRPSDVTTPGLVLVVDDLPDISDSVAAVVAHYGHPCHTAQSSAEAATLLAHHCYETVLLDLDMPGGQNGVELAAALRRRAGPNQCTYLVAMTAARPTLPAGLFDEVLIKPVEGSRVWWNLGHRSRVLTAASETAPASPPSGP
ncbi:MAG: response regulator [Comamonadaceae bacterium]|nr:MAG: response regulator [Comamonadaceae bacterium]